MWNINKLESMQSLAWRSPIKLLWFILAAFAAITASTAPGAILAVEIVVPIPFFTTKRNGLADEHLCPVISAGTITHADLRIGRVEDVGPMAAGIHPPIHNGGGSPIPVGNVFTRGPIGEAKSLDHLEGSTIGGAGMGKIPVIGHILGFIPRDPG